MSSKDRVRLHTVEPVFLCAINARYNHTNIAVRSIVYYVREQFLKNNITNPNSGTNHKDIVHIDFGEWTINEPVGAILRGVFEKSIHIKNDGIDTVQNSRPLILFSVYIWNVDIVFKVIRELKKIIPTCILAVGGPEVSYRVNEVFEELPELDFIISGEGEHTVFEVVKEWTNLHSSTNKHEFLETITKIAGVYVSGYDTTTVLFRQPFKDLSVLPFPYPQLTQKTDKNSLNGEYIDPDNKIFYYESSRGCPFNCAYCLSSIDKTMRFMPLDRVFADLQRFLDAHVKLVKFVDRTFN
ncbi:MAG TPA: cobalamin-dependent protein, partial [Treponemataceae bacterium]|nr:cobalamin-dependent protein [Treponemataceae bacterium]